MPVGIIGPVPRLGRSCEAPRTGFKLHNDEGRPVHAGVCYGARGEGQNFGKMPFAFIGSRCGGDRMFAVTHAGLA